jgi:hypothetical protein
VVFAVSSRREDGCSSLCDVAFLPMLTEVQMMRINGGGDPSESGVKINRKQVGWM